MTLGPLSPQSSGNVLETSLRPEEVILDQKLWCGFDLESGAEAALRQGVTCAVMAQFGDQFPSICCAGGGVCSLVTVIFDYKYDPRDVASGE